MVLALAAYSAFLVCMYHSDFQSPLLFYRASLVVIISHVLRYYCIIPSCYPKHNMYVGSIMFFNLAHVYANMYYKAESHVCWAHHYSLYFSISVGIGMPSPPH